MQPESYIRLQASDGWILHIPLTRLPLTFGRAPGNDIEIPDANVSRLHCGLEMRDGVVHIVDLASANGTVVGDRRLDRGESMPLIGDAMLVLGSVIVRVLVESQEAIEAPRLPVSTEKAHGVCLVDICDSTELPREHIEVATRWMRDCLVGIASPADLLLLKNLGDGFLAIFAEPQQSVGAAKKLLRLQAQQTPAIAVDVRVTLDCGPTFRSSTSDRIGLVINRAARLEKTQRADLEELATEASTLRPRNRCIGSDEIVSAVGVTGWTLIGRRRLKGFGDRLYGVHQISGG